MSAVDHTVDEPLEAGALGPLRIRDFRLLWGASLFSNIGTWLQVTAGAWLMWELTASPTWVGWMTGSRNLPMLFLALPAGVFADRFDRLRVLGFMQGSMGGIALTMALLTWAGWMTPLLLLLLGLAMGFCGALAAPSWHSLVPDLVPRHLVPTAVALNSVAFNVARTIGPALGGVLVAALGAAAAFGVNGLSYGIIIAAVLAVSKSLPPQTRDSGKVGNAMLTGIRFARHTPAFRRVLMVSILFALGTAVLQAMLPVRTEELGLEVGAYGLMLGSMGVGAAIGGVTLTRASQRLGASSIPVTIGLTGAAGVCVGLAPNLVLTMAAMAVAGLFWVWTQASLNSTVQLMAPGWVRGRAVSLWLLAHGGMVPIGAILSGVVAEQIGAGGSMVVLSAATVALGLGAGRLGMASPTGVTPPEFTNRRVHPHPAPPSPSDGPVMVVNTWTIPDEALDDFLDVMREVRLARLKTGGSRWQLYQELGGDGAYSETFIVASWEEHLKQHERIDDDTVAAIRRARQLDASTTGPTARHFLGVDPMLPATTRRRVVAGTDHESLHAADGSLPAAPRRAGDGTT
jgi:MFS family permease